MAALGRKNGQDFAFCPAHQCKRCSRCPHPVQGPAVKGSSKTFVDGKPALRVGDSGVHDKQTCCGPNMWKAMKTVQARKVFIEGKEAFCVGDITLHDGKDPGKLMVGSSTVFVKG